jgi:hypothetical protein
MNIEEKAKELLAQKRSENAHLKENMLTRGVEEVHEVSESITEEKARELLAGNRLNNENLEENMLTRAVEEIENS